MKCIVQKYGGSSVADIDKIKKIAGMIANVKREGYDVAVVVSAMSKTTNNLIELAKNISSDPPKREMDMLLSTGERITMALLCIALNELGIAAISLTGSQSGIITNDRHNDARVIEVRPFRVQDEMARGRVVVVGGFQGVSYTRDITTLGRGGSDTSAVALAAALNAERCEIYSDIDGVYTADPSQIKEAEHLPEISYQQMQEMSLAGAKVLNAQAVQFAKEAQIAIYARSTFQPGKETIVRKLAPGIPKGVKSVVSENDVIRVRLSGSNASRYFKALTEMFEEKQIPIKELSVNYDESSALNSNISFIISHKNIYGWDNIHNSMLKICNNEICFDSDFGALSLIGEGLSNDVSTLNDTLKYLNENNIQVFGVTTTSFRISIIVKSENLQKCVALCHKMWIEEIGV